MVLSLFLGIGLLDHAFELEGFTIVRGPDLLWGGDVRNFHVPAGVFAGVIGGPPCQKFSTSSAIRGTEAVDLIPEFLRVVREAQPEFVVMARGSSDSQYVKDKGFLPGDLPVMEYARLQGAEAIGEKLEKHKAGKPFAVHVLGNGVPVALGRYVARAVRTARENTK